MSLSMEDDPMNPEHAFLMIGCSQCGLDISGFYDPLFPPDYCDECLYEEPSVSKATTDSETRDG